MIHICEGSSLNAFLGVYVGCHCERQDFSLSSVEHDESCLTREEYKFASLSGDAIGQFVLRKKSCK